MKAHVQQLTQVHLFRDGVVLMASLLLAVAMVRTDIIETLIDLFPHFILLEIFITGFFFTSIATVAPATVALGEFANSSSPLLTATVGALGAVFADLIIFKIVRGHFSQDISAILSARKLARLRLLLRGGALRYTLPLLGALAIASPLPDELGVGLLGLSRLPLRYFVLITYALHVAGIFAVVLIAQSVAS